MTRLCTVTTPAATLFLTYGYDQHLLLASIWTERSSFESAYASALEKSPSHARTVLYRPNHDASDKLSIPLIVRTLDEYLNSYNTSEHFAPAFPSREFIYGVQTYELLAENLARDFSDGEFTNLRNLQVLWEHKRLMADRAELLSRAAPRVASLVPALREVEREAKALRNLALQARHSGGGVDRNALVRDVSRLQRNEARTLTKLLARLGD